MLVMMSEVAEHLVLAEITNRLIREFPGVTPAQVDDAVNRAYARFANSPIRDFVPLFVEKHARHHLAQSLSIAGV